MNKLFLLISIIVTSISAAYAINAESNSESGGTNTGQYFTVENQTNMPLRLKINAIGPSPEVSASIPAKSKSDRIYMESGSQPVVGPIVYLETPFYVGAEDNSQIYIKGFIVFNDASATKKYSYLDKVTTADKWKVDTSYSCRPEGKTSLENKIIIKESGDLVSISDSQPDKNEISCHFLKNSQMDITKGTYQVTCSDGSNASFMQLNDKFFDKNTSEEVPDVRLIPLAQIFQALSKIPEYKGHEMEVIKATLDVEIGKYYCLVKEH